jgi:hypothetical protein
LEGVEGKSGLEHFPPFVSENKCQADPTCSDADAAKSLFSLMLETTSASASRKPFGYHHCQPDFD